MSHRLARACVGLALGATLAAACAAPALGAFPYTRSGGSASDYKDFFLTDETPSDLTGKLEWMYAATPESGPLPPDPFNLELGGVRGGHLADAADAPATAWETTTGRPDVAISVLDSGIKWDDDGAMSNIRFKTWLNRGELPVPNNADGGTGLDGAVCASYTGSGMGGYDINSDAVFNIRDYACDDRVSIDPPNNVNPDLFEPQDILIAFSGGAFAGDDDSNGFVDDMVGWDFLDDDNDPYDDVQYGHGTGEAQDSTAEANNGGELGACPNCMSMHMRVGDSFVADVNRFAQATIYGVDNGALVIQEALGTLNNSRLARQAVEYAYDRGVTVIASAADEAAQHNNWPSSLPHVILVNSVTQYDEAFTPAPRSYLQFTGCTNFNAKITLSIPSVSCSSDATGRGSGMAGIIYSAALNAYERDKLEPHPSCVRAVDGPDPDTDLDPCVISPNEVRQLMASGTIGGTPAADDVDFLPLAEPNCAQRLPGCTDPYQPNVLAQLTLARPVLSPLATSRAYPAREGHDQFYGYGRVNLARGTGALVRGALNDPATDALLPPEVEITSPQWFDQIDPADPDFELTGRVSARPGSGACTYRVLVAPGHYPGAPEQADGGDFVEIDSDSCDTPVDGVLATVNIDQLEALFPVGTSFDGAQPPPAPAVDNGRPFKAPNGFVVKVIASTTQDATALTGEDQRAMYLHRDADLLDGFPRKLMGSEMTGDGESSPALADLDGDNRNELIVAGSDGFVHAFRPNGSELPNWPVRGDQPPLHTGGRAFTSSAVSSNAGGAILASVAVDDVDHDGIPEVFAADMEGKVYGWDADGDQIFSRQSDPAFSGKPQSPFANVRQGKTNRTQHGFIGSPVLADMDGDPAHEIVAASMDRHVYAWDPNGSPLPGFPVLVVDPAKVASVDPATHRVAFNPGSGSQMQGAIIDTPAVGDLDGDPDRAGPDELPEIVVGTNEEYEAGADGGVNADALNGGLFDLLSQADVLDPGNSRLYALKASGDADSNPLPGDALYGPGWPVKIGLVFTELLPVVGEGITGSPVIAPAACPLGGSATAAPKVGSIPGAGFAYVLNSNGSSCYGSDNGKHRVLQSTFGASPQKYDTPMLPAVGHPAFGDLGGPSPSFVAPAAGVIRALDLAVNEYQGGQDFLMAWNTETSVPRPGFPGVVNDLQFLTGPSVADIDGIPGDEIVAGTASADLVAFTAAGTAVPGWPKLTGDWTVANPTIGSFGTLDTAGSARKRVIGLTRSGYLTAYETDAAPCTGSSWPRFHHDNANSGSYERDAVLPGAPTGESLTSPGGVPSIQLTAPGDDLLCGNAAAYEVATSNSPITEASFDSATALAGVPAPAAPGTVQELAIPDGALRHVAVRAADDQGNVGRVVSLDRGAPPANDDDNDGVLNGTDNCQGDFNPDQSNIDGDAQGDACDPDDDGDSVADGSDNCPAAANPDQADADGDGTGDVCDATPNPPAGPAPAPAVPTADCATPRSGGPGADTLIGSAAGDLIRGLRGRDRISGAGGDDCLFGNKGGDRVSGDAGADEISGGNSRDRLIGGPGPDRIRAGSGPDLVRARDGERDTLDCGSGRDRAVVDAADRVSGCERVRRPR